MTARHRLVLATSALARTALVGGAQVSLPDSTVHARTVGTAYSLCGVATSTWFTFPALAFDEARPPRCPRCVAALRALRSYAGP